MFIIINIRSITEFAMEEYKGEPSKIFMPKDIEGKYSKFDQTIMAKTQQAATIMQFKLEGQIIKKHPEFHMEDRLLLDKINYEKGTLLIS